MCVYIYIERERERGGGNEEIIYNHRLPNGVRTSVYFAEVPQYTISMT